ncbi:DUF899 domain-containing protein [Pseudomonas sp. GV071]|uniref:DUF899 domain-containing protein n=1 Tax=Pseudomonas sp. GV071 TaxID=2135754 RepID=UPI000D3B27BD|nr:DUF899 domain-containing protein [Pseudomonas sp. GV071]PTQ69794.1 putative dithiol-disulfide oxidoreductase (DUF899 family) [Pseudomonas sp. GV071]
MNRTPEIVSPEHWLEARKALLKREKAFTTLRDQLNEERRRLPMVAVTADYRFDGPQGEVSLLELFAGCSQLLVYHYMFHRDTGVGCPGCSFVVDNIGHQAHMQARDTRLVLVSRAPLAEIEPFKQRMGWTLPWYSSFNSRFNYDYHVTLDPSVAPVQYNFRDQAELQRLGLDHHLSGEQPGVSVFLRDGEQVFHTYSTYGRGLDLLDGTNNWLDLTPFGRREGWGGMPDLHGAGKFWWKLHDQYEHASSSAPSCCKE